MMIPTTDLDTVVAALVAALTVFNGHPDYHGEEQLVRAALDILGYTAVSSAGEPL